MWLTNNQICELLEEEKLPYIPKEDYRFHIKAYSPKKGEYGTILAQYKKFMLRHSDWYNKDLFYHFDSGNGSIFKYGHSYCGFYSRVGDKERPYLRVFSHFMPYSIREGYEMIASLLDCKDLCIFAVTPYLANMLDKLGFIKQGEIPQMFAGKICTKIVYTNRELDPREVKLFSMEF